MNITEVEFDRARRLEPSQVLRYLRRHGWRPTEYFGRSRLWELPADDDEAYEVLVSGDKDRRDYPKRMLDLLETLVLAERRGPASILLDLETASVDEQFVHLYPPTPSGTAPLLYVLPALAGYRDLLMSAATTADTVSQGGRPAPIQAPRRPSRVKEFVGGVRLAPSLAGSYILAVQTPAPAPEPAPMSLFDDDEDFPRQGTISYQRRVTTTLYAASLTASHVARSMLDADDADLLTEEHATSGLSANLCEALARIGGDERNGYSLSFTWSPDLPAPVAGGQEKIGFSRPALEALQAGATSLRKRFALQDVLVCGDIIRLHRVQSQGPGIITVLGTLQDERPARVRHFNIHLTEPDYALATRAHGYGDEVQARGNLTNRGNRTHMEQVREFQVLRPED